MAHCPYCKKHFREPEDEQGEHDCPKCGRGPGTREICEGCEYFPCDKDDPQQADYCPLRGINEDDPKEG